MLDEIDKEILFELDLNCRVSSIELSKKLKIARQTVDYRIAKLCDTGVIENFHACFSLSKLGFRLHKVHCKLRNIPKRKAELKKYLYQLGNVYWIGESSGSWDLLIGLFYKKESEVFPITNNLNAEFSDIIVEYQGHATISILQFPKMFLVSKPYPFKEYIGEVVDSQVDELDTKIIAELVQDARVPVSKLAKRLGTSSQIVQRRIKKLESSGVLFQYRIGVNFQKLDIQLYKAIITLNQYTSADHERFFKYISQFPALQYFLRNFWTIELELNVKDYEEYIGIINGIKTNFPQMVKSLDSLLMETDEWTPAFTNFLT